MRLPVTLGQSSPNVSMYQDRLDGRLKEIADPTPEFLGLRCGPGICSSYKFQLMQNLLAQGPNL